MSETITVHKHNAHGQHIFSYAMRVIERSTNWVYVEGEFLTRDSVDVGLFVFRRGDIMREWFYSDRYYNVFRVHDATTQQLKGFYCNITRPARITAESITADDLELDVLVSPDGVVLLDDEDEFNALNLPEPEHAAALNAVETIKRMVTARQHPFDF